jgi:hypothetical protein
VEDMLRNIGPQLSGESGLARRVRFHQSWYRAVVLGLPFSVTAGHTERSLGSILSESDGTAGHNFLFPEALALYKGRRKAGWGVDPVRCERYLTSSQALTLNLLSLLVLDPEWMCAVIRAAIGRSDLIRVSGVEVEFAPARPSEHLGDKTRVDALVHLDSPTGHEVLIIEVKYADRFNSRSVDVEHNRRYANLAKDSNLWRVDDHNLWTRRVNQLLRCHALGASVLGSQRARSSPPCLLLIHHPLDVHAVEMASAYQAVVTRPETVQVCNLDRLLATMRDSALTDAQRSACDALRLRYLDHGRSEQMWAAHLASTRQARSKSTCRPCAGTRERGKAMKAM